MGITGRRQVLAGLAALPLATALGCGGASTPPIQGEIIGASDKRGHRLRAPSSLKIADNEWEETGIAIVGGGVAGLAAAWQLSRSGAKNFVILELEDVTGGTSRGGKLGVFAHPWGAHYLPTPMRDNTALVELLDEMGVIEGYDDHGEPQYAEVDLCRDPEERLWMDGKWHEGLWPPTASAADQEQHARFQTEVQRWVDWRDEQGRRAFAIPIARGSDAAEVQSLDRQSFAIWLDQRKLNAPMLRWWLEYATRDDYGTTLAQTSAWAGLFYFASRVKDKVTQSQPLLTWPDGNGRLVAHLSEKVRDRLRAGHSVLRIETRDNEPAKVFIAGEDGSLRGMRAKQVIYAAPQFTAPYVLADFSESRRRDAKSFRYGAWLVANLLLRARPANVGFDPAWDNVLYDSQSLGYVAATHQLGQDHGATVWTYYYPFTDDDPAAARERLLAGDWKEWSELVLSDLEQAHPELRSLVERIDVMRWGHAMIQPRVGFLFGVARARAAEPWRNVHFAHSDLSGVALFEEAFAQGLRAASAVHNISNPNN